MGIRLDGSKKKVDTCPVCDEPLEGWDLFEHIREVHSHIDLVTYIVELVEAGGGYY